MDNNQFDIYKWQSSVITSCQELSRCLKDLNLNGKCIRQIWNIGLIYNLADNELDDEGIMFAEVDEPVVFVFDEFHLEILFSDGSTVHIATDTLTLKESSYQGVVCSRDIEKCLPVILNTPISEVMITKTDEVCFTGAFGLELPKQDEYIDEIVFKFNSGFSLHINAWYDFMHLSIRDKRGKLIQNKE